MVAAGLIFAWVVLCVDNVEKPSFFHQLQNSSYYSLSFGQHAADVYLEYSKEQHTEIWRLMAKYLLGQCFMWTILGNTIFLVDFRRFRASTLNRTLWVFGTTQRTTY